MTVDRVRFLGVRAVYGFTVLIHGVRFGRVHQVHGLTVTVDRVRFLGVGVVYVFPVPIHGVRFRRVHQVHGLGVQAG